MHGETMKFVNAYNQVHTISPACQRFMICQIRQKMWLIEKERLFTGSPKGEDLMDPLIIKNFLNLMGLKIE